MLLLLVPPSSLTPCLLSATRGRRAPPFTALSLSYLHQCCTMNCQLLLLGRREQHGVWCKSFPAAHSNMASGQRRGSTGIAGDMHDIIGELRMRGAEVRRPPEPVPKPALQSSVNAPLTSSLQALADIKLTGEALKKKLVEELDRCLPLLPPSAVCSQQCCSHKRARAAAA